jgi:hypothetical protein
MLQQQALEEINQNKKGREGEVSETHATEEKGVGGWVAGPRVYAFFFIPCAGTQMRSAIPVLPVYVDKTHVVGRLCPITGINKAVERW